MSARIDSYSLKNQSQDPYFAIAPQTMTEVSAPQKTVHWDRVAIVSAIGLACLAMVSAYLLSRGIFEGPQLICKTKPILLSKACPEAMDVLQNSCAANPCLNLTDCNKWKIGKINWFNTQLICLENAHCDRLLNSARSMGSLYVEPFPYCIKKSVAEACPDVINYLQTACSNVINYDARNSCKLAANSTITLRGIFKDCFCDINCDQNMLDAKDLISEYMAWGQRLMKHPSNQKLLTTGLRSGS